MRKAVAKLSTRECGVYYPHIARWWDQLQVVLESHGFTTPMWLPKTNTNTVEGYAIVDFEDDDTGYRVCYTLYQRGDGDWEVMCYLE